MRPFVKTEHCNETSVYTKEDKFLGPSGYKFQVFQFNFSTHFTSLPLNTVPKSLDPTTLRMFGEE